MLKFIVLFIEVFSAYSFSEKSYAAVSPCQGYGIQWNLSNPDTLGTEESVLISEVS